MAWANPNEGYMIFRCTNLKYAKLLQKEGSIMFNTPKRWIEIEKENGAGQGDKFEGVFKMQKNFNRDRYLKDDEETFIDNGLIYFRRKSVIGLPTYCFYILTQSLFEKPNKVGKQELTATVPGKYFQDFSGIKSKEEYNNLKNEDKPALVVINDGNIFIERIKSKLISMGVLESEILVQKIDYKDMSKLLKDKIIIKPKEIFVKDKYFEYQSEGRIVINTSRKEILAKLIRKPINIGSLEAISEVTKYYFKDGAIINMDAVIIESEDYNKKN